MTTGQNYEVTFHTIFMGLHLAAAAVTAAVAIVMVSLNVAASNYHRTRRELARGD